MSYNAADGAALVAAAVQAAVRENAPRRTVAAVAAAVAGTVLSAAARATPPATRAKVRAVDVQSPAEDVGDPAQLLASLRAARRAQRARKKERRKAARQAASDALASPTAPISSLDIEAHDEGAAGQCAGSGGTLVAAPAHAPGALAAETPPLLTASASPWRPSSMGAAIADDASSAHTLRTATLREGSVAPSAGGSRSGPYAATPGKDSGNLSGRRR